VLATLAIAVAAACSSGDSAADRDRLRRASAEELTRELAVLNARNFVVRAGVDGQVYLDSTTVDSSGANWLVMFRRRKQMMPSVLTVEVNRRTAAMRFFGDE
jgi:hypothetical protein